MKKGLVIQGPMFSPGYGPYEFSRSGSFEKEWIEYDCRENVRSTIKIAINYFDHIVISTWKNEDYREFLETLSILDKVEVVILDETETLKNLGSRGIHKYHQIETLRAGLQKLAHFECVLAAKIRTDHNLDIRRLSNDVDKHQFRNYFSLGVPNINLYELDRLTDFYFVGRTEVMHDMCSQYLNQEEFCADTHKDYFLGFLKYLSRNEYLSNLIYDGGSRLKSKILSIFVWSNYFYPLNAELFKNFYWRGRKINHRLNGWIRWFHVFHSGKGRPYGLKFITNLFMIFSVQQVKRPTIKLSSFVLFRFYRFRSQKI